MTHGLLYTPMHTPLQARQAEACCHTLLNDISHVTIVCDRCSVSMQCVNAGHRDLLHAAAAMRIKEYLNSTQQLSKPTTAYLCHAEWHLAGWAVHVESGG